MCRRPSVLHYCTIVHWSLTATTWCTGRVHRHRAGVLVYRGSVRCCNDSRVVATDWVRVGSVVGSISSGRYAWWWGTVVSVWNLRWHVLATRLRIVLLILSVCCVAITTLPTMHWCSNSLFYSCGNVRQITRLIAKKILKIEKKTNRF